MPTFPRQTVERGTLRCHICGEVRTEDKISVEEHKTVMEGTNTKVIEQVLYCNDKAECGKAAPFFSFVAAKTSALGSRPSAAPGERPD